jgi:ribosomal protein S18 acetylase RimI-like enzyme
MKRASISMTCAIAPSDISRATAVLSLAFAHDPVMRWQYPDPAQYLTHFPDLVRAFGGGAVEQETARYVGKHAGVALWLRPGSVLDHHAIEATLADDRRVEIVALLEGVATYHPSEPHWYLTFIGVDPACHGQGLGAMLMEDTLQRCDQSHTAAYLESTNPISISLYQRLGFKLLGTVQTGSSPPLFPMLRSAR